MISRGIRWGLTAAVLAGVVVVGALVYQHVRERMETEWEAERDVLVADVRTWQEQAARNAAARDSAVAAADSMRAQAEREHARAERTAVALERRAADTDAQLATIDSLPPVVAQLVAERNEYRQLYEAESAAFTTLSRADMALRAQLEAAEGELLEAHAKLDALVQLAEDAPGERAWYVPHLTLGYGATLDRRSRTVHDGPSAVLGWEIGF